MADNPYQPPQSGFEKPPRDLEPGSIFKAVLFGAATDIGGTILIGIPLAIVYGVVLGAQGQSNDEIQRAMESIDPMSTFGLISSLFGLTMSALGGFVCARTANVNSYTAVGILSAVSVTFGTVMGAGEYEWPLLLLLNLLSLMAIFTGGWWYIRKLSLSR
jgi:hypothetical protein